MNNLNNITMTNQQLAYEIYNTWQTKNDLKNWKQDERYATNTRANQNAIHKKS